MKKFSLAVAAVLAGSAAYAQSAVDAYRLSQPDMKGTARYMGMAGAFGALGGDLSVLSHNPGGIGVYRSSEVGFTLDLDLQNSNSNSNGLGLSVDQTKFLLNNIGFVYTFRTGSEACPNVNIGFTYNKNASFNRRYRGAIGLNNSLSNYIAAMTTQDGYAEGQLLGDEYNNYDPYNPTDPSDAAPWLSILGYDGYLMSQSPAGSTNYVGQWTDGMVDPVTGKKDKTEGTGYFDVQESGGIDSYNIALGGNISNVLYWGMDFDITHINYNLTPQWTEELYNARVGDDRGVIQKMDALWTLGNYYNCSGTGFNYKLGFILKPIHQFRLGFAFETPTWYRLTETFYGDITANYSGFNQQIYVETNGGYDGYNDVNFRTPWKINASAAAILFDRLIISAEYEWTQYKGMKYSAPTYASDYWYDDPWDYPWSQWYAPSATRAGSFDYISSNDPYHWSNEDVKEYYCNTNTLRLGAELNVLPNLSVRAGYSFVSSPVQSKAKEAMVYTSGTIPNYRFDNTTNYVTCGLGFKIESFYINLAYVYKHMDSEYHAFSPYYPLKDSNYPLKDSNIPYVPTQKSSLSLNNSQIVLSAGFKF